MPPIALDGKRFTIIAHGDLPFWNPVSAALLEEWLGELPLFTESRVLDIGCGRGELLLRTAEMFGCAGIGFDIIDPVLEEARREAARRLPEKARPEFVCRAFDPASLRPGSFDVGICIGSTHALDGYRQTLDALFRLVRPGGFVLVGEGYWRQDPAPEYLSFLGCDAGSLHTHRGNMETAEASGLRVLRSHEATEHEWAHYEDTYAANARAFLDGNPDDPDAPAIRDRIASWREAYLAWGKNTLGFGLYLMSVDLKKGTDEQ